MSTGNQVEEREKPRDFCRPNLGAFSCEWLAVTFIETDRLIEQFAKNKQTIDEGDNLYPKLFSGELQNYQRSDSDLKAFISAMTGPILT